jgi:hypothetical protein
MPVSEICLLKKSVPSQIALATQTILFSEYLEIMINHERGVVPDYRSRFKCTNVIRYG